MKITFSQVCILALLHAAGCGDEISDLNYMPDDLPAGSCRGTSSGTGGCETDASTDTDTDSAGTDDAGTETASTASSSTGVGDQCTQSDDCTGGFCIAAFDPEFDSREGFECVFACLENYSDASWCSDAKACCDPSATCSPRGYCLPPAE